MLQAVDARCIAAASLITSIVAVTTYIFWTRQQKPSKKAPVMSQLLSSEELEKVEWESVGHIKKIWLYPVKSCTGVSLQSAQAWPLGLTDGKMRDRSFAFTTPKGNLIRGSMIGATVRIKPVLSDKALILKHPDVDDLTVDLDQVETENVESTINIHGDIAPGLDCGDVAADWLEKVFKKKARLLYHSNLPSPRKTEEEVGTYPLIKGSDNALYADKYPFMLMTKESIADLQSRVNCPTPPENFRPNFLVEGTKKAFDEDDWGYIKIGDAVFRNLSPCTRCTFTTVNHETGIKEENTEPLRTLKTYRCKGEDSSPFFGLNLGLELLGTVRMEDEVFVTRLSK